MRPVVRSSGDGATMPSSLRVKVATEVWEFEQIHALNHQTFAEEIPRYAALPTRRLIDRFHDENTYVIGLRDRHLAGMIAIRSRRPFSLDERLPNLDSYLPPGRSMCEIRLLAVDKRDRTGRLLPALLAFVWRHCLRQGYDLALISGTTRQLKLYAHLGFVPFGPLVGPVEAQFQPMMLTLEQFAPRVPALFRRSASAGGGPPLNFLPGPVTVGEPVSRALERPAESHRSAGFAADLESVKARLCEIAGADRVDVLLGSGTAANDAIAGQLSLDGGIGLVLSNGEFGERLSDHARRFRLRFETVARPWGCAFEPADIERRFAAAAAPAWMWFVHCETSTGMLNDLDGFRTLCSAAGVKLCVDVISSIGTVPINLAGVCFASGVSGKGLGAFPGLSFVFRNHDVLPAPDALPRYLDLGLYARDAGIPFTQSSNLVRALHAAVSRADWESRFRALADLSVWLRERLRRFGFEIVAPEDHASPGVVTIALPSSMNSALVGADLENRGYLVSVRSRYLLERNWMQVCFMGETSMEQLAEVSTALLEICGDLSC